MALLKVAQNALIWIYIIWSTDDYWQWTKRYIHTLFIVNHPSYICIVLWRVHILISRPSPTSVGKAPIEAMSEISHVTVFLCTIMKQRISFWIRCCIYTNPLWQFLVRGGIYWAVMSFAVSANTILRGWFFSSPLCFYPRVLISFPIVLCATYQRIMFHLPEDSHVLFPEDRIQFSQRIKYHYPEDSAFFPRG